MRLFVKFESKVENMAITTTAPYTSSAAVIGLIKRFRDKGLSTPITGDVLLRASVSESLVPRTLQALQLLDLIDDAGQPTPIFQKMRSVPEVEYKKTLSEWVKSIYKEVFLFVDPATDDLTTVRDAFRSFTPHGQQDRMVSLFIALCVAAGLGPEGKKSEPRLVTRKPIVKIPHRNKVGVKDLNVANRGGAADPGLNFGSFPPALAGLLQSIPSQDKGWTQQNRDKFMSTFGTVLDFVVPIMTEIQLQESESNNSDLA